MTTTTTTPRTLFVSVGNLDVRINRAFFLECAADSYAFDGTIRDRAGIRQVLIDIALTSFLRRRGARYGAFAESNTAERSSTISYLLTLPAEWGNGESIEGRFTLYKPDADDVDLAARWIEEADDEATAAAALAKRRTEEATA